MSFVQSGMAIGVQSDITDTFTRAAFYPSNLNWKLIGTVVPTIVSSTYWQAAAMTAAGTNFEMATDNIGGEFVIANRANSGKTAIMICCNAGFDGINIALEVETGFFNNNYNMITNPGVSSATRVVIPSGVTPGPTGTTAQAVTNGSTVRFTYTKSDNTFRSYYNGTLVQSWTDSSNTIPHGPGYRYCGVVQSSDANTGVGFDSVRFFNF